jgi:iron complex outermembrane receptor protein
VHLSQHSSKLTWKAGLDEQITPDNLLYGSISTGYKPGGGNPGTAPAVVPPNYAPETITAFEVGSKNSLLDRTFLANLAAFYYIDKNMQYHAEDLINFDGGVDNLPKVDDLRLRGEFTALLPAHFRVDAFVTAERGHIATHISKRSTTWPATPPTPNSRRSMARRRSSMPSSVSRIRRCRTAWRC